MSSIIVRTSATRTALLALAVTSALAPARAGAITYSVTGTWDTDARRNAAISAMNSATALYNGYGTFNKAITVTYNASVATADANYNGSLRFGGTWPETRVTLHEISHTLGIGTTSNYANLMTGGTWDGARGVALVRQFEGDQAVLNGDAAHFWPYGLNFDNEASAVNNLRHVATVYAMRADMNLGPTAHPSAAETVTLVADDALGTSGFNYAATWSDGHFAHAGAAYATGNFALRTPASANSFTFAGDSLTVNNTSTVGGGFYYKGSGTTGVVTVNNLVLDGGWVRHLSGAPDLFRLDGKITVASASTIHAKQGNINVLADVAGDGDLAVAANDFGATDNGYVRFLSSANTFTGSLNITGRFELTDNANLRFLIGAAGDNNAITGAAARRVLLNGDFEFDLLNAAATPGAAWRIVTAANTIYGNTFTVEGFTEPTPGFWTNGAYTFSEATGTLSVVPEPGSVAALAVVGLLLSRRRTRRITR